MAEFIIMSSEFNDVDVTEEILEEKPAIYFYYNDDTTLLMTSYWSFPETQSYGRLLPSTDTTIQVKSNERVFVWNYQNSFNNGSGSSNVKIIELKNPKGKGKFALQLRHANGGLCLYNGDLIGAEQFFEK